MPLPPQDAALLHRRGQEEGCREGLSKRAQPGGQMPDTRHIALWPSIDN